MKRCALVTGGSGFLGSYVVRDLLAEGFECVVVLMRGGDSDECEQRLRSLWLSIMIKMADASIGSYDGKHLDKPLVDTDWETIARAVDLSYDVFEAVGVSRDKAFFGTLNAGHPGGCFPLTEAEASTLHHDTLPGNLFLADASLLPRSMGNPPSLTIMALAKRVARLAAQRM